MGQRLALFDAGAVPDLILVRLFAQIGTETSPKRKKITVANGVSDECTGFVKDIPVIVSEKWPN